ncbi:hypothetical protein B0H19DRAFT_959877, partial [Mycena capillaripes]
RTCDCGGSVTAEEQQDATSTIQCSKTGCESVWYHLICVELDARKQGWLCQPCGGGKQGQT